MYKVVTCFWGDRIFFETFEELMRYWAYKTVTFDTDVKVGSEKVMVFHDGIFIPPHEVKIMYDAYHNDIMRRFEARWKLRMRKRFKFRNGPVEGINCRVWRFGSFYKKPRTKQEMAHVDEYTRGKRRKLPNSWDDNVASFYGNNNWKRYRKHQWKEK